MQKRVPIEPHDLNGDVRLGPSAGAFALFHYRSLDFVIADKSERGAVLPGDPSRPEPGARGRHAQALAYAAQRRRAAQACSTLQNGVDAIYWKAGVPAALARAIAIRSQGFAPLP